MSFPVELSTAYCTADTQVVAVGATGSPNLCRVFGITIARDTSETGQVSLISGKALSSEAVVFRIQLGGGLEPLTWFFGGCAIRVPDGLYVDFASGTNPNAVTILFQGGPNAIT